MAREVRIAILGDARDFNRAMDSAHGGAGRLGGGLRTLGVGVGIAAVGIGALGFKLGKDFVAAARESEMVTRITENAIRATGGAAKVSADEIGALANSIMLKTGIDDEQIQTAANMLLTFKNIRNEVGAGNDIFNQATQAVTDLSIQFGGMDGAAKMVGKALNDPIAGMTALGRAGVTFSAEQKKRIKGFVEDGNLLGAQQLMLAEIQSQVGGAAAAAADPFKLLGAQFDQMKETVGLRLLPVLTDIATWLSAQLPGAITAASAAWGDMVAWATAWWGEHGPAVKLAFETLGETIKTVAGAVRDVLGFLASDSILAKAALVALGLVATAIFTAQIILWFRAEVAATRSSIAQAKAWVTTRVQALQSAASHAIAFARMVAGWLLMGVKAMAHAAVVVAAWLLQGAQMLVSVALMGVQAGIFVAHWLLMGVKAMAHAAVVAASWLIALGPIGLLIAGIAALVVVVVKNWDKIKEKTGQVIDWIKENWPLLLAILTGPFGLAVLAIVKNWDTIKETAAAVKDWIIEIWNAVVEFLGAIPGRVLGVLSGMWGFIKDQAGRVKEGAIRIWENLVTWVTDLPGKIISALGDVGRMLYESGKKIIQGLIDGIKSMLGAVKRAVTGILDAMSDLVTFNSPAKEGPFSGKGWTEYSGVKLVDGFIEGMTSRKAALSSAAEAVMNSAAMTPSHFSKTGAGSLTGTTSGGGVSNAQPMSSAPASVTVPIYLDGREIARYIWNEHGMTSQMARAS